VRGTLVSSVAFASRLGVGVGFAAATVFVVQGTLSLLLLDVKRIPVANLLPALVVVVALTAGRLTLGW
jgi:uncharacterized membrane protein YqgA involved in biofilm formation